MDKFELSKFTDGRSKGLCAFASDLEWKPGYFPPYITVGDLIFNRISLDSNKAVYRNGNRELQIFND